jgi:hypothetical protein
MVVKQKVVRKLFVVGRKEVCFRKWPLMSFSISKDIFCGVECMIQRSFWRFPVDLSRDRTYMYVQMNLSGWVL